MIFFISAFNPSPPPPFLPPDPWALMSRETGKTGDIAVQALFRYAGAPRFTGSQPPPPLLIPLYFFFLRSMAQARAPWDTR
jgi:hypothetical protein